MADLSRWAAYLVTGVTTIGALHKADQIYGWAQEKVQRLRAWWEKPPELAPPYEEPEYIPIDGPETTPEFAFPQEEIARPGPTYVQQPAVSWPAAAIPTGALSPSAQYTSQQLNDLVPRGKKNGLVPHFPTDTREYDRTGKERRDVLGLDYTNVVPGSSVQYIQMGDLVRSPQVPNDVGRVMDARRGEFLILWMSKEDPEWAPIGDVYRVEGMYN